MSSLSFVEVKEAVAEWLWNSNEYFKEKNIALEIIKDEADILLAELDFGECLAEIVVDEPYFAPYRYVAFQAVKIVAGAPESFNFWYDGEGVSKEEIINNLNKAVKAVAKGIFI